MDLIEQLESLERRMQLSLTGLGCSEFSRGRRFQIESTIFALQSIIETAKSSVSSPVEEVGTWLSPGAPLHGWQCGCVHASVGTKKVRPHSWDVCNGCLYLRPDLGNGEKPACAEQAGSRFKQKEIESGEPLLLEMPGTNTSRVGERLYGLGSVVSYIQKLPSNYGEFAYSAMVNGSSCPITQAEYDRLHAKITEAAHSEAFKDADLSEDVAELVRTGQLGREPETEASTVSPDANNFRIYGSEDGPVVREIEQAPQAPEQRVFTGVVTGDGKGSTWVNINLPDDFKEGDTVTIALKEGGGA